MITAHFIVNGEERETREVGEDWLERVRDEHENVLLADGNTYIVESFQLNGSEARVVVVPPEFARGS